MEKVAEIERFVNFREKIMVYRFVMLFVFMAMSMTSEMFCEETITSPTTITNAEIARVQMVAEQTSIQPGKSFWICFDFQIAPDWHLYWKNPGEAGLGPEMHWTLPPGLKVGDVLWPTPDRLEVGGSVIYGYSKQLLLLAEIIPSLELEVGKKEELKVDLNWLACSTTCVPSSASFTMHVDVASVSNPPSKHVASIFKQARRALPVNSRFLKTILTNGALEMRLQLDRGFNHIQRVLFFPEQGELVDVKQLPSWKLANNKRCLDVRVYSEALTQDKVQLPLKGILVVEEDSQLGQKRHAWNIFANAMSSEPLSKEPSFEKKYKQAKEAPKTNVEEHLEALEAKVWYRQILKEFSVILHSDLLKILILAFVGGMLLNVMPCVLPVISFKLLHFAELRNQSRMQVAKHGILYSFGILISFWVLSGAIYALQFAGKTVGWGFQLQEPVFVAFLIIVLFILSLSLFGVFEFGLGLSSNAGAWDQSFSQRIPLSSNEPSLAASFFSGVLATLVASPCTGPLLGTAVGFAATLHPTTSFAIFSALGLGMAFPFLLVSFFPAITKLMPKPGRWMVTFKQLMGFFMLATILWLVWVLDAQTKHLSNLTMLINLFIISLGVWVFGTWGGLDRSKRVRLVGRIIALTLVIWGSWMFVTEVNRARQSNAAKAVDTKNPPSQLVGRDWEEFSLPRLERLRASGVPVFVDVTAKWCLTCQANKFVLESDAVKEAFIQYGVVKMLADWTTNDEAITKYLRSIGRNGVPVYAVYSGMPNAAPKILPEVVTIDVVIEALKEARKEFEGSKKE